MECLEDIEGVCEVVIGVGVVAEADLLYEATQYLLVDLKEERRGRGGGRGKNQLDEHIINMASLPGEGGERESGTP